MKFSRSFKIALNILFHSRLRSWLTIIGIVIGIAAIVSIISIGEGAQKRLEQNLNSMNVDVITINSGFSRAMGMGAEFRGEFAPGGGASTSTKSTAKNLTTRDVIMLKSVDNIKYIMGVISGNAEASYLGKNTRVSIEGVDVSVWKNMVSTELLSGRYLIQGDVGSVVIGGRTANSTFNDVQINRQITIGGSTFKIVGILKESGGSDDSRIFMPIDNAVTILEGKEAGTFDSILVKISDISLTDTTIAQITSKLMLSHSILQQNRKDFSVSSLKSMQETVSSTLSSMSLFLSAIAAISLIVGAIGIMNTMFTSVLEKTREIGILKAIGAKNLDILNIFLLNSAIIGLIGGVFGVILGIFSSGLISQMAGTTTSQGGRMGMFQFLSSTYVSPQLIIGAFAVAILVGLISGAIPAYGASRMNPIEALRYE
jgi:putative ABC transport system permease protein